jgi:hypothetical protein
MWALLIIITAAAGCAAPASVQEAAGTVLHGDCKALFLNGAPGSYQHVAHQISGKAVFALGIDSKTGSERCGMGRSNVDVGSQAFGLAGNAVSWEQLESIALARCEASGKGDTPCRVFARNNNIVWNQAKEVEFK